MPQFDLLIWISLSFWTILIFQMLYYILTYFILAPFSNFQKTIIKLYLLKNIKQTKNFNFSLVEYFLKIYLKKNNNK